MRFCESHWSELRTKVDAAGLGHLVAQGGAKAAANMKDELEHGLTPNNFDPLMAAHNQILSHSLEAIGIAALGEGCPLCTLIAGCKCGEGEGCAFKHWIDFAVDGCKTYALEHDLLKGGATA